MNWLVRFAFMWVAIFWLGCVATWLNLIWTAPAWFRYTCAVAVPLSGVAFFAAFIAARVRQ